MLTGFMLEVPQLEGAVMTSCHHLHVVLHELGSHDSVSMASQSVLNYNKKYEKLDPSQRALLTLGPASNPDFNLNQDSNPPIEVD